MADTHGNTKTSDKVELSTIQLQTLTKVTGMGEDEIREAYGQYTKNLSTLF